MILSNARVKRPCPSTSQADWRRLHAANSTCESQSEPENPDVTFTPEDPRESIVESQLAESLGGLRIRRDLAFGMSAGCIPRLIPAA